MKKYETPVIEAELIEAEDVILASGGNGGTIEGDNSGTLPDLGFGS